MTLTVDMPDWREPMSATLTQDRFVGRDWLFERKFDGIRLLAYKRGADVQLYSRNRLPQNLPAVANAVAALPVHEVVLDGEVTWGPRRQGRVRRHARAAVITHPENRATRRLARRAPGCAWWEELARIAQRSELPRASAQA